MDTFLANKSLFIKLLYLIIFTIGLGIICNSIGQIATQNINTTYQNQVFITQFFFQLGCFMLPSLLYFRFFNLKINWQPIQIQSISIWLLFFICIVPISSILYTLNQGIHFPELYANIEAQLRASELKIEESSQILLAGTTYWSLIVSLLIVAVLPAIAEELFFRGCLQKALQNATNGWIAVLITSIVFSAIHFQFFSFAPRFLLGTVLGYAYLKSQNLLIPMLLHFINNSLVIIWTYLFQNKYISISHDYLEQNLGWKVYIILVAIILGIGWRFSKKTKTASIN